MRYLVFNSEQESETAQVSVHQARDDILEGLGYSKNGNGIVPKSGGKDKGDGQRTVSWSIPRLRLDGKWVILHPEKKPLGDVDEIAANTKAMLAGIISPTIEEYEDDWFAVEEGF